LRGLYSVIGGKLTSFRALAQEVIDRIGADLGQRLPACATAGRPLGPGPLPSGSDALTRHLGSVYGGLTEAVLALARLDPALATPLCRHGPDIAAQALYAARHEGARTVADVLLRRTPAGWSRCRGVDAAPAVARVLAIALGWDACAEAQAVTAYHAEVDATLVPLGGAVCAAPLA
jgi:glycerol-3-phosphate dehydrogenase